MRFEFKGLHANGLESLKPELPLSDFKTDVDLISFLQQQQIEKQIFKVIQMIIRSSDSQMGGNNEQPKKAYIEITWEAASYNKQKDQLKTGEALIHVDKNLCSKS